MLGAAFLSHPAVPPAPANIDRSIYLYVTIRRNQEPSPAAL